MQFVRSVMLWGSDEMRRAFSLKTVYSASLFSLPMLLCLSYPQYDVAWALIALTMLLSTLLIMAFALLPTLLAEVQQAAICLACRTAGSFVARACTAVCCTLLYL